MKSSIKRILTKQNGYLTVEAALVLPIFICAILTIGFMTKLVYTHEIVQHAINEAANEMSASSYIYYTSGIYDIDDTISNELEDKKQQSEEHIKNIATLYKELNSSISEIESDAKDEMMGLASLIAKTGYDKSKTVVGNVLISHYMKKHGLNDKRLKRLNIEELDLSSSTYFNNNEDIDVIVKYNMNIPLPIKFTNYITIVQRAKARAWMGGEDHSSATENNGEEDNNDIKVYTSKKGSSYHRFGCYHIFKEIGELDLQDAKKLGLLQCKKCKPPLHIDGKYTVFKSKRSDDGRYHREGCDHLFKDIKEINLYEAIKKYKPCKTCKPPG